MTPAAKPPPERADAATADRVRPAGCGGGQLDNPQARLDQRRRDRRREVVVVHGCHARQNAK
jgi:hypothetical protein